MLLLGRFTCLLGASYDDGYNLRPVSGRTQAGAKPIPIAHEHLRSMFIVDLHAELEHIPLQPEADIDHAQFRWPELDGQLPHSLLGSFCRNCVGWRQDFNKTWFERLQLRSNFRFDETSYGFHDR